MTPALLSSSSERIALLDGWRGAAILLVLISHFMGIPVGRLGVELFFVLSGRLMAELLFVRQVPLESFFKRRIARVWPTTVVFCLAMGLVFSDPTRAYYVSPQMAISGATFSFNYFQLWASGTEVIEHVWSLCIEEHSYILLGIIAYVIGYCFPRPSSASASSQHTPTILLLSGLIVAAIVLGAIQTWVYGWGYNDVYWRSEVRGASILMGSLAFLLAFRESFSRWLTPTVVLALGAAGVLLNIPAVPDPIKYSIGTACLAITMAHVEKLPAWAANVLSHRYLQVAGLMSFSLYLWQQPFSKFLNTWGWWDRVPLLAAAIVTGLSSFYLLEQPTRRWLNRHWAGSSKGTVPSARTTGH